MPLPERSQAVTDSPPTSGWSVSTPLSLDSAGRGPDAATAARLRQLQDWQHPDDLCALVLALVQNPDSTREARAWAEEVQGSPQAPMLPDLLLRLPRDARLPLLEWAAKALATQPSERRAELLRSARRVMSADGRVQPMDRMRWLLIRHLLSGARAQPVPMPRARAELALADLPDNKRLAIARFTAYLARMVPMADPIAKIGSAGVSWYGSVMRHCWLDAAPPCQVPDADAFGHALTDLQQLSWMQRPVLTRLWVQAALKVTQRLWPQEPLTLDTAEALRITAVLLDTPVPGAVAGCFTALPCSSSSTTH